MITFIFHDGVGIGAADAQHNPFLDARIPTWRALAGGSWPTLDEPAPRRSALATVRGVDARLGVAGLPQSGTGTTALLTGVNVAQRLGRHAGPYPPREIRPLLEEENLLARAARAGRRIAFANAYPPFYLERLARGSARRTTCTQAALAAGLTLRDVNDLAAGRALSAWITNGLWRRLAPALPDPTPREAGTNLGAIARDHDLTLYEFFHTDHLGHRPQLAEAQAALATFDEFLAGVIATLDPARDLLILAADHGNFEDQSQSDHTLNPALVTVWGADQAEVAASLDALTDVAPALLRWLGVDAR